MLVKQEVKARSVYEPRSESLVTMETKFGERPNADASILSPVSEAVANELQELSLQPAPNLLPVRERKNILQLKLQQRRSREELVKQGIMPPLKSSAAFHEQRRSLERARTEDYLKRKIKSRPERSELIRMHILEETSAESSLQAKQLQLKRARLADDLNDKISHRPGPMELIHKNILPVHSSIKQAIIKTQFPRAAGENSSCDEDSSCSLSPDQPVSQESPLGLLPLPSPPETLTGSSIPSPTQVPPPVHPPQPMSGSSPSLSLTNEMAAPSAQRTAAISQIKFQPKPHSTQKHKKSKDNKPKIKKLKYHQYIPPDQKGDKEPPPHLDSSYAKILQQQQLFLQLQILNQQQQHYNYHAILPAPPKPQTDQQPSSSSSSNSTAASSPPRPITAPSTAPSNQESQSCQSSAPLGGTKPVSLPPNLDEMKVAELKSELKLRSLPVSGTKNDLIERLRTYQDLNGGSDTSSSPTAGGTTGPGAEGADKSSKTAATTSNSNTSQQQKQYHCHQTSSVCAQSAHTDRSATPAAPPPQQRITRGGGVSHPSVPLTPPDCSPGAMSPEEASFNSNNHLQKMMSSPPTQLSLQPCSAAQLPVNVKEERKCCSPETCQFSLKTTSVQRHRPLSSTAPITATTASGATMDKDKMLREKDKQIEELTRMLRQKQRLVEVLRMQLERRRSAGRVPEPLVLVRVKQEPPDKPSTPVSSSPTPTSVTCERDASKVCVKQEAIEAGEVVSETTAQLQDTHGLLQSKDQMSTQTKQQKHICLQQTALQFAQQQAIQKLLLQQQQNIQNQQQMIQNRGQSLQNQQNLQKLPQQRKRKPNKQQLKQPQQQLLQHQQSTQHQQQMQLKQQTLSKQQNRQQQQTKQLQQVQIQSTMHLKQQQVQQVQQQQSGSAPSLPLDLHKSNSTPTLVTDHNGNHFLITLTNHITENQRSVAPESKTANQTALQRLHSTPAKLPSHNPVQLPKADNQANQSAHTGALTQKKTENGRPQVCADQLQQEVSPCLSAPPCLQPFFTDQETTPSAKNTASHSPQSELCTSLDVLFSPLSPASVKTTDSSPDNKDAEHEEDFIDIILQTGEMLSTFKPAPDPSLEHLNSKPSSPPPSQLQLFQPPFVPPCCDTLQSAPTVQPELQTLADTTGEKQHLVNAGSGRLEDFLESTTGKPLLGVEPGGLLTLIDDLHSQMLCTPSILDHPPSPMDTFDMAAEEEEERGLDSMDWLDLTMGGGGGRGEETPTLTSLGPQTPPSVFSTDFLDSYDLQAHWDSCL